MTQVSEVGGQLMESRKLIWSGLTVEATQDPPALVKPELNFTACPWHKSAVL